jgi:hypothetical protein
VSLRCLPIALVLLGCQEATASDPDTDTDGDVAPVFELDCAERDAFFLDAAEARYPGSEARSYYLARTGINFIGSTEDGSVVLAPHRQERIQGRMILRSRYCDEVEPGLVCNVLMFDGTWRGVQVSPDDGILVLGDGFWCHDAAGPLWFAGLKSLGPARRPLFLYAQEAGIPEPPGEPVHNPSVVIYGLDVQLWEVPGDCTLDAVPCGEEAPLATGRMLRSDALSW